ncbi:MAG: enoyl-CoA hydratase-related protein, partial [Acidobacteriota bacterium]
IPPAMTSLYVLRKTTLSNLSLLSLSGEIMGAQEALSSGLVNRLFAMESFDEESNKVEGDLLEAGPSALRKMKNIILKNSPVPTSEMEEFAATQIAEAMESEEFKEGISSLMEKKTPNWVIRKDK